MTDLFLAFNHFEKIPTGILNGMQNLKNLDLSKNKIERIEKFAFGLFDDTNRGGIAQNDGNSDSNNHFQLLRLNLAGNKIKEVIIIFRKLIYF